jgi:hypothetical protein
MPWDLSFELQGPYCGSCDVRAGRERISRGSPRKSRRALSIKKILVYVAVLVKQMPKGGRVSTEYLTPSLWDFRRSRCIWHVIGC